MYNYIARHLRTSSLFEISKYGFWNWGRKDFEICLNFFKLELVKTETEQK